MVETTAVPFSFKYNIEIDGEHSEYSCNWSCSMDDHTAQWLIGRMCQSPKQMPCQDGGIQPEDLKSCSSVDL